MNGKKVLVVGLGKTGIATANRLCALGADVTVTDAKEKSVLEPQLAQLDSKITIAAGGYGDVVGVTFDCVVTSPGVDWYCNLLEQYRAAGTEVISELELAFRLSPATWVAVTGTNGKTTTTSLVGAMLSAAGKRVVVCGNIGNPAIGEESVNAADATVVAEVSSFQLEGAVTFAPRVVAVLNVAPDHLDRHKTMEVYTGLKCRIFARQSASDACVLNFDDPVTIALADAVPSRLFGFSALKRLERGAFLDDGTIMIRDDAGTTSVGNVAELKIVGQANVENALAACAIASCAGANADAIRRALFAFEPVPHRMEVVAEKGGVRYINDSKGTNVSATLKALEGIDTSVALILGGRDKDSDFAPLATLIRKKNAQVILIGEATDKIASALSGYPHVKRADTLEEAVATAASLSGYGDTVLLSPACASFDMFANYMERGEAFRRAVVNLAENHGAMNA